MAERSKAMRLGRTPLLWAWVRMPLLTIWNILNVIDRSITLYQSAVCGRTTAAPPRRASLYLGHLPGRGSANREALLQEVQHIVLVYLIVLSFSTHYQCISEILDHHQCIISNVGLSSRPSLVHETKQLCQKWDSNPRPQKWTAT